MKLSLRRALILFAAMIFALATGMTAAQATTNFDNAPNGAHYAKGSGEPVCTLSGLTVTCTATQIAGVGNTNATVKLVVNSTISGVCHNPGNDNVVDPFSKSVTAETSSNLTSTKNGRLVVPEQKTTATSNEVFLRTFSCPNPNWRPEVTSNVISSFTYTLTFAGFTQPAITITGP
jgi:hypothetical protein